MSTATLNGLVVTRCRVTLPAWGAWYAEVEIDRPETLSGAVTLVLADLTLRGTILSGGPWQGRARFRIVGGAGGWGRTIAAQAYANDVGMKLAKVLGDAAAACGETLGTVPALSVGPGFVRAEGRASLVLEGLVPAGWYVDEAGVTQVGRRPARAYTGAATRLRTDLAAGTVDLAASELAALLPGAVVDGIEALDVEHTLEAGKLRTTIWGRGAGADAASLPDHLRKIVATLTAGHRYFAPWEYRVVQRVGERYDLQAVRVSSGMPDLRNVRVRPGVAGIRTHLTLGSLVLVSFVDGNPSRPVATAFDDVDAPGFVPADLYLQAGATGAAPTEHATSAEAVVGFVFQALKQMLVPTIIPSEDALATALGVALGAVSSATIPSVLKEAIDLALADKDPNTDGTKPGIGWPHVRGA